MNLTCITLESARRTGDVAAKRKRAGKTAIKKATSKKSARKAKPARAKGKGDGQRELHHTDLRKVMLASVLKRLR